MGNEKILLLENGSQKHEKRPGIPRPDIKRKNNAPQQKGVKKAGRHNGLEDARLSACPPIGYGFGRRACLACSARRAKPRAGAPRL